MTKLAPRLALALALALCCALGCSDDSDDTGMQQNPSTEPDAATATRPLTCDPGYVEACSTVTGGKPVKRCTCVKAK